MVYRFGEVHDSIGSFLILLKKTYASLETNSEKIRELSEVIFDIKEYVRLLFCGSIYSVKVIQAQHHLMLFIAKNST